MQAKNVNIREMIIVDYEKRLVLDKTMFWILKIFYFLFVKLHSIIIIPAENLPCLNQCDTIPENSKRFNKFTNFVGIINKQMP